MSDVIITEAPTSSPAFAPIRGALAWLQRRLPAGVQRRVAELRELTPHERGLYVKGWLRDRRGHRRPLPATSGTFLVVCHGNIMRSAVGDALLTHLAESRPDLRIESAGVAAIPGRPADPRAERFAQSLGLSLESHRSRPISAAMVAKADVILVMDLLNEARLLARYPAAASRVRLLGEFDPVPGSAEIPDPYLVDESRAHECFARVARCIAQLALRSCQPVRAGQLS